MQVPDESDFILRLVAIFNENDVVCEVTGENRLTVSDGGASFDITIEKSNNNP